MLPFAFDTPLVLVSNCHSRVKVKVTLVAYSVWV